MRGGYVNLWRRLADSGLFQYPEAYTLYGWLLIHANFEDGTVMYGREQISLKPGQVIVGRRKLAADLNLGEQKIRTALNYLKISHYLTIYPTHRYSLITLLKWGEEQASVVNGIPLPAALLNDRITHCPTTTEEVHNGIRQKGIKKKINVHTGSGEPFLHLNTVIPTLGDIESFCYAEGLEYDEYTALRFLEYGNRRGWRWRNGFPMEWQRLYPRFVKSDEEMFHEYNTGEPL